MGTNDESSSAGQGGGQSPAGGQQNQSSQPQNPSGQALEQAKQAIQQASQAVQQANQAVQQANQPPQQGNHPAQQANQPAQQANQPAQQAKQPAQQANQPAQQASQPAQQANQSAQASQSGSQYQQQNQSAQSDRSQVQSNKANALQSSSGGGVATAEKPSDKRAGPGKAKGDAQQKPKNFAKIIRIAVILLVIGGLVIFFLNRHKPEGKPGWLRISGRLEGYEVNVGAKIAGRVQTISNREGEEVQKGQMLVTLTDEDIQAQLRGAKARWSQANEAILEAEAQLEQAKEQVQQSKLNVAQAKEDAQGRISQAAAQVASQQATYAQAVAQEAESKADFELAKIRIKRYDELVVEGAVTQDEADQAHSTYKSALATVKARAAAVASAAKQVSAAQAALTQAKSNALNPPIRFSQQVANTKSVAQNEAAVARAKLEVHNAQASIDEIQSNIDYLNIRSPIHGIVTARTVEPGAVVAAGQTVISLIDLKTIFLRGYVPDSEIGKVRINQECSIYYDSAPKKEVRGKIIEIDPKASFTPENIYFRDDRVKQVFGIKIMIYNPDNYAKPGMPADADIDISPSSGATHS